MKQILLLCVVLLMFSCTRQNPLVTEGYTITNVRIYSDSMNIYTVDIHYPYPDNTFIPWNKQKPKFFARKNLYNIGDTVKFTK